LDTTGEDAQAISERDALKADRRTYTVRERTSLSNEAGSQRHQNSEHSMSDTSIFRLNVIGTTVPLNRLAHSYPNQTGQSAEAARDK